MTSSISSNCEFIISVCSEACSLMNRFLSYKLNPERLSQVTVEARRWLTGAGVWLCNSMLCRWWEICRFSANLWAPPATAGRQRHTWDAVAHWHRHNSKTPINEHIRGVFILLANPGHLKSAVAFHPGSACHWKFASLASVHTRKPEVFYVSLRLSLAGLVASATVRLRPVHHYYFLVSIRSSMYLYNYSNSA